VFISDFAIRKPVVTITVMAALVTFGIISLAVLDTDEFPDVDQPVIGVTVIYPGAAPETVAREVVEPLEDAFFSISGLDPRRTRATATDGLAQFTLFFDFQKNLQEASQDLRDAISARRQELPQEIEEPILTRFDPSDAPIISIALTSPTRSAAELTRLADPGVIGQLRSIPGVAQATLVGGVAPELTVELRPEALAAAGLGVAQVVAALQAQNLAAPVGRVQGELTERAIRLQGRLEAPADFEQMVVAERQGVPIRLGELARVGAGAEEPRTLALFGDAEAVGIDILKARGYSTTAVSDAVLAQLGALSASLPEDVTLRVVQDAGVRVRQSVHNVQSALVEGALLTVLVVFLFLNSWRSTVITGLALPVSLLAAFISVWAMGYTLNTMSLLGLTLAIGILIDDAIVVRENIVRHMELGKGHLQAAREGTAEIGLPVAATTFSIIAVFVPVAFMPGMAGQWFKPFALTMAAAVLVSLFVSFSLDPMLSAYWADPQIEKGAKRGPIGRALLRFNRWFDRAAIWYRGLIGWALDHRWLMVLIATGSFVGAVALQALFGGAGFIPVSDRVELSFIVETPPGSNLNYTRRKVEAATAIAQAHPEVEYTYSTLGTPLPLRTPGVDQALVYVRLVPREERTRSQDELGRVLRGELAGIAGARVSVFSSGFGGAFSQIQLQLRGPELDRLNELAETLRQALGEVEGAVDVGLSTRGQKPELVVELDRGLAGSLGITAAQVAQSLRPAFAGLDSGDWVDPSGQTRDVRVRFAPEARMRPTDLSRVPLVLPPDPEGNVRMVPLGQVAQIRSEPGPAQIDHLNRQKVVTVEANVAGRSLDEVRMDIDARLAAIPLPAGYDLSQGGEVENQREVFGSVGVALVAALLLMYLILVIQFGSFMDPLAILISLPLSLIGVVLALLLTGDSLNVMSLIGVILLMGIVAKNAILFIDFAKWAHEKGMPMREALIEAGGIRLRPIIMTSMALIAGMVPVALGLGEGGDFRAPLGRAVIGGLVTSTLLTLLVIPTVYEILDDLRTRLGKLLRRAAHPGTQPGSAPEESAK
jgi:hydrophobic/amphiphilic exporter-1 (mainly G- bacteria), HAE1 family